MASSKVMSSSTSDPKRTVDDVWRDIVACRRPKAEHVDEMMTLEDFLVKAGAAEKDLPPEVKIEPERLSIDGGGGSGRLFGLALSPFQSGDWSGAEIGGGGRGRRKLAVEMAELVMDRAAEQRQRRMIKNRESAARSRERKQAYQSELESLAVKLEEENERLLKEKAAYTKLRLKQLMERVIPVIEKRRPPRTLKRTRSMEW